MPGPDSWKQALVDADARDTVFLNRIAPGLALRPLRTARTTRLEAEGTDCIFGELTSTRAVYFDGDLKAGIALTGQVARGINKVMPAAQIFDDTMAGNDAVVAALPR